MRAEAVPAELVDRMRTKVTGRFTMRTSIRSGRFLLVLTAILLPGVAVLAGCGEGKPSAAQALAADADEAAKASGLYTPGTPKERPNDLAPPTTAEFKAWDRKDPEGEKHLYKWDKAFLPKMQNYWKMLVCFRDKIKEEGEKAFGAEPGSPQEEQWYQFKRQFIPFLNGWQQRLFAQEPRILEKSKFIGNILEAHELIMHGYPEAFNNADRTALEKHDANWTIVHNKVIKYAKLISDEDKDFTAIDRESPKAKEAWDKFCVEALTPPPEPKKGKKKRKLGPI